MQSAFPPPSPPLQFSPAMVAWLLLRLLLLHAASRSGRAFGGVARSRAGPLQPRRCLPPGFTHWAQQRQQQQKQQQQQQ